jgi:hypothetical protein
MEIRRPPPARKIVLRDSFALTVRARQLLIHGAHVFPDREHVFQAQTARLATYHTYSAFGNSRLPELPDYRRACPIAVHDIRDAGSLQVQFLNRRRSDFGEPRSHLKAQVTFPGHLP